MEVFSGVASGMAVASLSLQLLDSIGMVKTFIRDVRGASKELSRLADLLDRLKALLEDVRDVVERQALLHEQHFPAPSLTVHDCLKSCEDSLASLQCVLTRFKARSKSHASILIQIKDDVGFGLKTKEVAAIEVRIQREIDYLHTALNVNSTKVLMATMPALLKERPSCVHVCSPTSQERQIIIPNSAHSIKQPHPLGEPVGISTRMRQSWISSALNIFGIYQRKSVCYVPTQKPDVPMKSNKTTTTAVSESYEILFTCRLFRYRVQWKRQRAPMGIALSLSGYPVVQSLWDHQELIRGGSLQLIQQKLSSGSLHPYTRDTSGFSLLHIAAAWQRVDVCRLLTQYGLKPDITHYHTSPLCNAVWSICKHDRNDRLDTIRFLLLSCDQVDDFDDPRCPLREYDAMLSMGYDSLEWLWHNVSTFLDDTETLRFQGRLLQSMLYGCLIPEAAYSGWASIERIVDLIHLALVQHYARGGFSLMFPAFRATLPSYESEGIGDIVIDLLGFMGLDVEACIHMELEQSTNSKERVQDSETKSHILGRKYIFESLGQSKWRLRWVWDFDPCEPGYLLVSEHVRLGADSCRDREWPFSDAVHRFSWTGEYVEGTCWEKRFNRREAKKMRKERARSGQKGSRRMPGAWSW